MKNVTGYYRQNCNRMASICSEEDWRMIRG